MKIAFDAKRAYCNFTGLGNHSRTTLDILTRYFPDNDYVLYTPKVKHTQLTDSYLRNSALHTVQPTGWLKGSLWRTYRLAHEASQEKADVFHGLSNELPCGLSQKGIPSVVTIHDVAFHTFPDMYQWIDRQIYDRKWKYALSHADSIIAISESTKRDILRYYDVEKSKIRVIYQPAAPYYYTADCIRAREEKVAHRPFLLYVGSINSRKNLLGAVRALEMLPASVRLPLVVVGNGREYMQEVQRYIEAHRLHEWVEFRTKVEDAQLHELYATARAFIYPSFCEGFGLPLVEARLSGCPVISSNLSSLPEAAGPYSLLTDPHDTQALSQALDRLITDDDLHRQLSVKGREDALAHLHPQVLAGQLMDIYRSLARQ